MRQLKVETRVVFLHLKSRQSFEMFWPVAFYLYLYLYLFICQTITIITKKCQKKKCRKKWRGDLKETIELMLIRPPQLFFEDGSKNYGDGYKIISGGKLN